MRDEVANGGGIGGYPGVDPNLFLQISLFVAILSHDKFKTKYLYNHSKYIIC